MESQGRWVGRHKAFTLMELLSVTAVVSILMALLVSAVGRMSQSGKEAKAMGTMRNVLRCAAQSQVDNGGIYYRKMVTGAGRMYWLQYFAMDYCDFDPNVLRSPLDPDWDERLKTLSYALTPSDKKTGFSYAMNMDLPAVYPDPTKEPSLFYVSSAAAQNLSQAALFFEAKGTLAGFRKASDLKKHMRFAYQKENAVAVGYLDGHIDLVKKDDMLDTANSTWTDEQRNIFWTGKP